MRMIENLIETANLIEEYAEEHLLDWWRNVWLLPWIGA